VSAEDTGRKAAHELLEAIESGGCVDKYIQVGRLQEVLEAIKSGGCVDKYIQVGCARL
jgi:RNA 3'-terminal phosphate cyclase